MDLAIVRNDCPAKKDAHLLPEVSVLFRTANQLPKLPAAVISAMKASVVMPTEIASVFAAIMVPAAVVIAAAVPIPSPIRIAAPVTTIAIIIAIAIRITTAIVTVSTSQPGAGSDEGPAAKPLRAVVPIGRARIRCISVISIGASRRTVRIRTYADAEGNLRMRVRHRDEKD